MQRISLGNALKDQKGITGLETAIVLIAFVVVAAAFAFTVITTGLFSSEKAAETATAGLGEASTSLTPKGSALASGNHGNDSASIVRFKLANSGAQAVGLPAARTLVTYSDTSNPGHPGTGGRPRVKTMVEAIPEDSSAPGVSSDLLPDYLQDVFQKKVIVDSRVQAFLIQHGTVDIHELIRDLAGFAEEIGARQTGYEGFLR